MSIIYKSGSIFDSECDYLVNPVNCVGVMGAGLAAEFRRRYPIDMFLDYRVACATKELRVDRPVIHKSGVILFATKRHWQDESDLECIRMGLDNLVYFLIEGKYGIDSIAFPQLGCGLGGLDWKHVQPVMEKELSELSERTVVEVWSYE